MTSHRIGVNLRVSGNCDQGARKYMEDNHVIKFLKKDTDDYEFAYFGIFDGHGGPEASAFCKDNLLNEITKYSGFWTDDDEQVLQAIRKGFHDTHNAMWNVLDTWPKTPTGLPSTAGSTATIAIVKQGKLYTGHVGDSALVLGENDAYAGDEYPYQAVCITKEHKPDDPDERLRIEDAGGEVINKSGVPRVVWSRPKINHKGPVRRSTQIDQIPFLAVARSLGQLRKSTVAVFTKSAARPLPYVLAMHLEYLFSRGPEPNWQRIIRASGAPEMQCAEPSGDLWSYDYYTETYVVSPDPDVTVLKLDPSKHRCIILASDGLWNMLTPEETVNVVMDLEAQFEQKIINDPNVAVSFWNNPAEHLVSRALNKWRAKSLKADNTSCVVVLIDPLGPSKLTLLRRKRQALLSGGEMTGQLMKMPSLPTEIDHRGKTQNKNANCSLSDSHIRVNDDSILRPALGKEDGDVVQLPQRRPFTAGSKSEFPGSREEFFSESVQYISKPPLKWNLRHSVADERNQSVNTSSSHHTSKNPQPSDNPRRLSPSKSFIRKSVPAFTRLKDTSKVVCSENEVQKDGHNKRLTEQIKHVNSNHHVDSINDDFMNGMEAEIEDDGESDSDYEKMLPKPPPCTPCSAEKEPNRDNESDKEDSLHSSADVTNKAFTLASDESIESPESSFGSDNHPPTPQSAPAKLSGTKRGHISKRAKRQLAKSGRKLHNFSKPLSGLNSSVVKSAGTTEAANLHVKMNLSKFLSQDNTKSQKITKPSSEDSASTTAKDKEIKNIKGSHRPASPPRPVLNTSKSMNNVVTPKNQKEAARSISCSGLTPDMNLLMSEVPVSTLNKTIGTSTTSSDITTHLFSTLIAAGIADSKTVHRSRRETCMTDDTSVPPPSSVLTQTEPLKQLNKTELVHKSGSKRWGSFLKASKLGIDQVFHFGNHRKGPATGGGTLATTSSGKLDCGSSKVTSKRNSSVSTSRLADITLSHHLPDVTVSHLADITLNASTITADDLTNFSALSAEDSMLSADELTAVHHSMLDAGMAEKVAKKRKGFLQKTRVTLRRARKAAKKAFFPENHRLFNKPPGSKRRSDEFLPTPELKRRRQFEASKSKIS